MSLIKYFHKNLLKKEPGYASVQRELSSLRKLNIKEYIFMGSGCCETCNQLNEQTFLVSDAKVGINCPPMHPCCKCYIIAKPMIDMFKLEDGANPLKDNPKFIEWKKRHGGS